MRKFWHSIRPYEYWCWDGMHGWWQRGTLRESTSRLTPEYMMAIGYTEVFTLEERVRDGL